MKAVGMESFEGGVTLLDLPIPEPGEREVLVKVDHASINGFDVAVANGAVKDYMEHRFPAVLGKDFAGTIERVGEGVTDVVPGQAVCGVLMRKFIGDGTFGEYVVVPIDLGFAVLPDGLAHYHAGALGLAGATADAAVTAVEPTPEDTIFVSGATGGVGSFAIQLLRRHGATVLATARPGEATEFVTSLGAQRAIDYTTDITEQVRDIAPDGVDAAIHLAGDPLLQAALVRDHGRFASALGAAPEPLAERSVTAVAVQSMPSNGLLEDLAAAVLAEEIHVPIRQTYALEEVPRALAEFPKGKLGKVGVSITH